MVEEAEIKNEKRNLLEEQGAARAVASGAYALVFALLGSVLLMVFTIMATGNPGLAYYGEVGALIGIFQVFASGFSQAFIAKVKETYVEDPEKAIIQASAYTKVLIFIGICMAALSIILALLLPDPFITFCLIMIIPPVITTYIFTSLGQMLNVKNRFDITAFIGAFFGILVFAVGYLLIVINAEPVFFVLIPYAIAINGTILSIVFYRKVSEYSLKDLYTKGKLFSEESKEFVKYSSYSTLTNLESIGILGNLIVFLTTIFMFAWYPTVQILAVQLLTIIMTYAIVKVAIIFFAGPLNIEIAEAIKKENHDIVQETVTSIGRISFLIGLTFTTIVCAASGHILKILHPDIFLDANGTLDETLLLTSQILLILCAVGQACYGFAALFGNALIGSGHAKSSALGFGITLIATFAITPILVFFFGFIGAGIAMLATGLFVLPFILIAMKKNLKVKLKFRIFNSIPHLTIVFLLIFFYPIEPVLGHLTSQNNLGIALIGFLMLFGILFAFLIGIPFFGVMGPGDGQLIRDISQQFNIQGLGNFLIKWGRIFYYLNPFHKKDK